MAMLGQILGQVLGQILRQILGQILGQVLEQVLEPKGLPSAPDLWVAPLWQCGIRAEAGVYRPGGMTSYPGSSGSSSVISGGKPGA